LKGGFYGTLGTPSRSTTDLSYKMMNVIIRKNAGKQGRDDSIKQLSIQPHPKKRKHSLSLGMQQQDERESILITML